MLIHSIVLAFFVIIDSTLLVQLPSRIVGARFVQRRAVIHLATHIFSHIRRTYQRHWPQQKEDRQSTKIAPDTHLPPDPI